MHSTASELERPAMRPAAATKPYALIVEDEPALVELIKYNLIKEGYEVTVATDGEEALLTIEDDGIGGAEAQAAAQSGIGGTLMSAFAKQVHGKLEEGPVATGGRYVRIRMPRINGVTGAHPTAVPKPR